LDDEGSVPSGKILEALEELSQWTEKRDRLKAELKAAPPQLKELKKNELEMAKRHVKYYQALTKDMKRATRPTNLGHFMDSLVLLR
jgi:hypothetical protein